MNKRLTRRLDKLSLPEKTEEKIELSKSDGLLLVSILGRRDAIFWPWRSQLGAKWSMTETRSRQKEYLSGRVGVAVKADGKHQWKDSHAARQRLIKLGMITATHASGQVSSMFLTQRGEAYARELTGFLHSCDTALPVIYLLFILSKATSVPAVRESVLFHRDCSGDPEQWSHLTEMILPFLTSGMVTCHSDTQGRACYTPHENIKCPESIELGIEVDPDAESVYYDAYASERQNLELAEPRDPGEVYVPLPATGWGWPCYFPEGLLGSMVKKNDETK